MSTEEYFKKLPPILKVEDLMPILSIGRNAAYTLVRSGQIPSIRIGNGYRISKDAVQDFIRKSS